MNQHNLEKLFQEKFKDFEPEFPEVSWQNIKEKLTNEKPKKTFFWYKFSGIVASFFIFIYFINYFYLNNKLDNYKKNIINSNTNISNPINTNENKIKNKNTIKNENKLNQKVVNTLIFKENTSKTIKSNNQINSIVTANKLRDKIINKNILNKQKSNYEEEIINQNNLNDAEITNSIAENTDFDKSKSKFESKNNHTNKIEFINHKILNSIEKIENEKNVTISKISDSILNNNLKQNINTENIDSQKTEKLSKLNDDTERNKKSKWQFSSLIAPVFIDNTNNISTINPVLDQNSKQIYNSISFGAYLQYQITTKVGIRTGIAQLNSFNQTNDVAFVSQMDNNYSVFSKNFITFLPSISNNDPELLLRKVNTGVIKQEINYLEIPLEINYLLIDKKLQFNVLGGASMLILSNDNTYIKTSENQIINLGSANNLNKNHFSINFGLGASYPIFSKMRFQLQPTVRYQINTFSQYNSQPYYIGIFSGLSYNF